MLESMATRLNSKDPAQRADAVADFAAQLPPPGVSFQNNYNLHCHTFYSYNGYGYSPSYIAALAREQNWFAAGTVDFDVLDAVDEFLNVADRLHLRGTCGIESRVFCADLKNCEINSPGEPGVTYHMGVGFTSGDIPLEFASFAAEIRHTAAERTRAIVGKVNGFLTPVELDFESDCVALTPAGNVTERHVCTAYRLKAERCFPELAARQKFWMEKLALTPDAAAELLLDPVKLEGKIRSATMKQGGVGYVQASPETFPTLEKMNAFTLACGALPTICWLNGLYPGERDVDRLLDLHMACGAALLNIIPDRNWNVTDPVKQARLIAELDRLVAAAVERDLPVIVGTEMNAPGLKLVDELSSPYLYKHREIFLTGAAIAVGHTRSARRGQGGYLSPEMVSRFPDRKQRNVYFARLGQEWL